MGAWPYLRAVVRHPVLLLDGQRITGPGYDARTGLLVDAPGTWPPLPDRPTRDHAARGPGPPQYLLRFTPGLVTSIEYRTVSVHDGACPRKRPPLPGMAQMRRRQEPARAC